MSQSENAAKKPLERSGEHWALGKRLGLATNTRSSAGSCWSSRGILSHCLILFGVAGRTRLQVAAVPEAGENQQRAEQHGAAGKRAKEVPEEFKAEVRNRLDQTKSTDRLKQAQVLSRKLRESKTRQPSTSTGC